MSTGGIEPTTFGMASVAFCDIAQTVPVWPFVYGAVYAQGLTLVIYTLLVLGSNPGPVIFGIYRCGVAGMPVEKAKPEQL